MSKTIFLYPSEDLDQLVHLPSLIRILTMRPTISQRYVVSLSALKSLFLPSDHSHLSVNDMWVNVKSEVIAAIERFIPSKNDQDKI